MQRVLDENFNKGEVLKAIESQISEWRCHKITLNDLTWEITDYDGKPPIAIFLT